MKEILDLAQIIIAAGLFIWALRLKYYIGKAKRGDDKSKKIVSKEMRRAKVMLFIFFALIITDVLEQFL